MLRIALYRQASHDGRRLVIALLKLPLDVVLPQFGNPLLGVV